MGDGSALRHRKQIRDWLSPVVLLAAVGHSRAAFAQEPAAVTPPKDAPVGAPPAATDETPPVRPLAESLTGTARAEYEAGRILYQDGDYGGALLKFELVYKASKDPRLLWNMAAASKNLRKYSQVQSLLTRFLAEAGPLLTDADRQQASALLETVKPFIGKVTLRVNQDGAEVSVDGAPAGTTPLPSSRRAPAAG